MGTAFFLAHDRILYLITARHVIDGSDAKLGVFQNKRDGTAGFQLLSEIKTTWGVDWVKADDADIAAIPFGFGNEYVGKHIPPELFLTSEQLVELQDVFFLSYQPGLRFGNRVDPISRGGMISIINDDKTLFLDAFAFPGNSGSPVFLRPTAFSFTQTGVTFNDPDRCKFIGLIGEYLTYQEVARSDQTGRARVIFEENTGLARVWPVQSLLDLFASLKFEAQHKEFKRRFPHLLLKE